MKAGLTYRVRHALRDEAGGTTVLALFALALTVLCLGFAIDAANLHRHQNILRMAADAAAHAGASALARGATPEAAEAAAMEMVKLNMLADPASLLADPATDLRALVVNSVDGTLSKPDPDSPANAMLVSLQRSETAHNPIPTLVLGLFGFDTWSTGASSVATIATTRRCSNAAGLFAHGAITIGVNGAGAQPSDGLCIHSQQRLVLPNSAPAEQGKDPRLSLPTPGACSGGACEYAAAVNLIMPDVAAYVARLAKGFADPSLALLQKRAFFAERPVSRDMEPLSEVGADVRRLKTGDVVPLSAFRFRLMRKVPHGLVYLVLCGQPGAEVETGGKDEIIIGEWPESPALQDIALVTTCPIRLMEHARIEGSLIIALAGDSDPISAARGARIGDPNGTCDAAKRSIVMTTGNLALPSHLTTSNIAVVAGGDVLLGVAGDASTSRAQGISVHAGGSIRGTGTQALRPCPGAADPVLPALRVISYTMPTVEGWVTPVMPPEERDLPGDRPDSLGMESNRS